MKSQQESPKPLISPILVRKWPPSNDGKA